VVIVAKAQQRRASYTMPGIVALNPAEQHVRIRQDVH
jgi:hypothetical protein